MKKKCRVVMLPTNQKAKSIAVTNHGLYYDEPDYLAKSWNHLYIVSDDQIQVGNTVIKFIGDDMSICVVQDEQELSYISAENELGTHITCRKIIATTDLALNLPRPSKAFIEKYCQLGGIENVMVEYFTVNENGINCLKVNKDNEISIFKLKGSWTREELELSLEQFAEYANHELKLPENTLWQYLQYWKQENL